MMQIQTALDWNQVSIQLRQQLSTASIGYNPDLEKMYKNIEKMVSELSKLEVSFRRTHKTQMLQDRVDNINKAINHLEKLALMAKLMR